MKTRGNENEGETYQVRTGSELTGVVSERVLTLILVAIASRVAHYHAIVVTSTRHSLGTFLDSHSHMTRTLVV